MKHYLSIGFFLVTVTIYGQHELPDITLNNINGEEIALATYNTDDSLLLFSFWATWCVPCINELDAIYEVYPDWEDELDIEVIAVTIDDSRTISRVKPMVNAKLWDYEVLFDTNQEFKRFLHIESIPYVIVVKNGKIVYRHAGYTRGSEHELFEKLKTF